MLLQESRDDVGSERERDASVVFTPAGDILIWIGPEKIAEKTAVRNLVVSAIAQALPWRAESWQEKENHRRTSVGRMTRRICSMEFKSGLRPPCIVNIFSSMIAAMGKQLKQSVKVFQSLMLYLLLHSS